MEADFARYYPQHDLRHLVQPGGGPSRLTLRRAWLLIKALPPESALMAEVAAEAEAREAEKPDAKVLTLKQRTEHWRRVGQQQAAEAASSAAS